jgi:hypothetical protein
VDAPLDQDPTQRLIASIAAAARLPLYTRNAKDFVGLEELVEIVEV